LLAGKLVSVVAIHSLGGSRANRHHTSNLQPGATQPTQDEDSQAMSNPLELPLPLRRERHKNPLTITMIGAGDNHLPPLNDPPIIGPSRC
jgi:hypothetical protein